MKRGRAVLFLWVFTLFIAPAVLGQSAYLDNAVLGDSLKTLIEANPQWMRLTNAARSAGGQPVWMVEVGKRDGIQRPAMLVVGGIEGRELVSTTVCVEWLKQLAATYRTNDETKALLESSTIYVWPRVNPDAARHFFVEPLLETSLTDRPHDDDGDGLVDEDKAEDLNGDGIVSWMRVEDSAGEFILDPSEPRLLIKSDKLKGERGQWRYLSEGRDDDQDELWNEDGLGGVNLNRNFPFDYRYFAADAGVNQVSETETRALADFVVSHANIALVMTYGPTDTLTQTPKSEPPKRPPVTVRQEDIGFYREMGKLYRETLGLKKELSSPVQGGTFADWMYYHRGRLSLAAQPWMLSMEVELAKAKKAQDKPKKTDGTPKETEEAKDEAKPADKSTDKPAEKVEDKASDKPSEKPAADKSDRSESSSEPAGKSGRKPDDTRNEAERAGLKWLDENAPEAFLPWKQIEHPDFPGQPVEVGGYKPYALVNPPVRFLESIASKQGQFLNTLLTKLPRLGIGKVTIKALGNSVYDLKVQIENRGFLPTAIAQGETSNEVYPTAVRLELGTSTLISGPNRAMLGPLEGSGGGREVRWVIHAPGKQSIDLIASSMLGGTVQTNLALPVK